MSTAGRDRSPVNIKAARKVLYESFRLRLWAQGFGTLEEIDSDFRSGWLNQDFVCWLRERKKRATWVFSATP